MLFDSGLQATARNAQQKSIIKVYTTVQSLLPLTKEVGGWRDSSLVLARLPALSPCATVRCDRNNVENVKAAA